MSTRSAYIGGTGDGDQLVIRHAPQGEQLRLYQASGKFVNVIIGPLGSGKTTDTCVKALRLINDTTPGRDGVRRSRGLVMRNTTVDLKATTIRDWRTVFTDELGEFKMDAPIYHKLGWKHSDGITTVDALVDFVGFDALGDIKKLRGYQLTWLWIDEAKEMAKEIIDMAIGRLGRFPRKVDVPNYLTQAMLTTNAPDDDHWIVKAMRNPDPDWAFFVQPGAVIKRGGQWVVNPDAENLANVGEEYYRRQLANKKEDWIRRELGNEFVIVADGRPVHPDFNQEIHVSKFEMDPVKGIPLEMGADWGRTPAAVICQTMPNGQVRVLAEVTTVNTGIATFARALKRELNKTYDGYKLGDSYGDPSGTARDGSENTAFDLMSAEGLDMFYPAQTNDPVLRQDSLDSLLTRMIDGQPAILINPSCRMLIRGLAGGYRFKRISVPGYQDRYHDKPEKTIESHVCEGLHYYLLGSGVGDRITTPHDLVDEYKKVEQDFGGWHPPQHVYE